MTRGRDNPNLDALMADPLVRAVMRADHVEPQALKSLLSDASARLGARPGERATPRAAFADPIRGGRAVSDPCAPACCG